MTETLPAIPDSQAQTGLLVTYGITDEQILATKAKYQALTIEDEGSYQIVRHAIREVSEVRVGVEKTRVKLKASSLEFGRKVDSEAKRITALLQEIENPLRAKKQAVDDLNERAKREAEEAAKAAQDRADREAREAEEARHKAIRDAEEARIMAEAAKLAQERKALEAERAAQQAFFEAQRKKQAEMESRDRARMEVEKAQVAAEQKTERDRQEAAAQQERERMDHERRQAQAQVAEAQRKIDAERAKLEAARLEVEAAERRVFERKAQEEARVKAEREAKEQAERDRIEAEASLKREAERREKEQARLEALKPDQEKLAGLAKAIRGLPCPDVKNDEAVYKLLQAMDRLGDVARMLEEPIGSRAKEAPIYRESPAHGWGPEGPPPF